MLLGLDAIPAGFVGGQRVLAVAVGNTVIQAEASLLLEFEGTAADGSAYGHTVTLYGDAAVISGSPVVYGTGAAAFSEAVDTYMQATASADEFQLGLGNFTVEAWVYVYDVPTSDLGAIIDTRDVGGGGGLVLWYDVTTSKWALYLSSNDNDAQTVLYSTMLAALNTWTHVAATRQGDTVRLFIDGKLVASSLLAGYNLNGNSCYLGTAANDPGNSRNLPGYLDNVRLVKNLAVYTGPFTPPVALTPYTRRELGVAAVTGCTDPLATNYDLLANVDDGSCAY